MIQFNPAYANSLYTGLKEISPLGDPEDTSIYSPSIKEASSKDVLELAQSYLEKTRKDILKAVENPDPKVIQKLDKINQKRSAQGLGPINLTETSQEILSIYERGDLSPKQKKEQIEAIRKRLGLSKGEMKELFTKRLGKIYQDFAEKLKNYFDRKLGEIKTELNKAEKLYGKNSPEVQALKKKELVLRSLIEPQLKDYEQRAGFFNSLFPSFWSKVLGFFKKVGGVFKNIFDTVGGILKKIPGVSQIVTGVEKIIGGFKSLFSGKIGDFFKNIGEGILGTVKSFKSFLPLIPGIGPLAGFALQFLEGNNAPKNPTK